MFTKVLVANRGEIALRVIRACRELGVRTVAVYSDADARAPHVREADEAVLLGPAPSSESYLKGDAIIAAAKATGAEAIHPGYGFLSEREWFARAVRDAGLVWIGPPAEAIAAMGSKTAARELAIRAGTPVVPGTTTALRSAEEAAEVADRFGYPVLLKAAAGGGGKGMRVVHRREELAGALASAQREARNAFGDDAVYVEKFIVGPRHVEIQVLGDAYGTMLHLGERECSVQRRHQKMIEEAPSVAVSPELRARMGTAAVAAAKAAGYVNAGTCEFLLDAAGDFYFLEMNTRIQVEHPVTELVTGVDLVQWQLRIAAGERLPFTQAELTPRGWAIECRITSEDPANGFLPSTGRVQFLHVPSGPGVRWDGGIEAGSEISLFYDPMLAKLIVWAADRSQAIERMHRALLELTIDGVDTSRDFHLRMMENDDFRRGAIDIQWLEKHLAQLTSVAPPADGVVRAAIAAALLAERERAAPRRSTAAPAAGDARSETQSGWLRVARLDGLR
ncbi:MAG: acetyl-CoA carboxylase biotin carboxylase subunit [Gemmatimonadaceae bacterium]|nr:acetyl-CoA carboxylase biotin carboxylase subunit [Gemmatimonadaceae bacterium]NUS47788.1 acetyl-CoA carboxylase biotin carboxylase subunit [Gemmatimonadaceae bacterium]